MEGLTMLPQHDPKRMARVLREKLKSRGIDLKHSECLEIVAAQLDAPDWNTLAAAQSPAAAPRPLRLPTGWLVSNRGRAQYEHGLDPSMSYRGKPVMIVRHRASQSHDNDVGGLLQSFDAEDYRGKRIALRAWLKCQDVTGSGTIWMRVENSQGQLLVLDNMETREENGTIHGLVDWTPRSIVLDVSDEAQKIVFGLYLSGTGALWCADVQFAIVGNDVPVTTAPAKKAPENLDWSQAGPPRTPGFGYPLSRRRA